MSDVLAVSAIVGQAVSPAMTAVLLSAKTPARSTSEASAQ
jgi:hypothetical protein